MTSIRGIGSAAELRRKELQDLISYQQDGAIASLPASPIPVTEAAFQAAKTSIRRKDNSRSRAFPAIVYRRGSVAVTLMTFRTTTNDGAATRADRVSRNIQEFLLHLTSGKSQPHFDVVQGKDGSYSVVTGDKILIIDVTRQDAEAQNTTREKLARLWAQNLNTAVGDFTANRRAAGPAVYHPAPGKRPETAVIRHREPVVVPPPVESSTHAENATAERSIEIPDPGPAANAAPEPRPTQLPVRPLFEAHQAVVYFNGPVGSSLAVMAPRGMVRPGVSRANAVADRLNKIALANGGTLDPKKFSLAFDSSKNVSYLTYGGKAVVEIRPSDSAPEQSWERGMAWLRNAQQALGMGPKEIKESRGKVVETITGMSPTLYQYAYNFIMKYIGDPVRAAEYLNLTIEAARAIGKQYGVLINPLWFIAQMAAESNFRPKAGSVAGAQGLLQLMPGTAAMLGVTNSHDPRQNIFGGVKYLIQQYVNKFRDIGLALAAYNAGPGNVGRQVPHFDETQRYVAAIVLAYRALQNGEVLEAKNLIDRRYDPGFLQSAPAMQVLASSRR